MPYAEVTSYLKFQDSELTEMSLKTQPGWTEEPEGFVFPLHSMLGYSISIFKRSCSLEIATEEDAADLYTVKMGQCVWA